MKVLNKKLGRLPAKKDPRSVLFADFVRPSAKAPLTNNFWKDKKFPLDSFGNTTVGDCTIASQALMATRMEDIETKKIPSIPQKNVLASYYAMTKRLYGGGDTGANEEDALKNWRDKTHTFKDAKGNPLTIDAFTKLNHKSKEELKLAMFLSNGRGIKVCFNLPVAFQNMKIWDLPKNQPLLGDWTPGSWGGHSMFLNGDYDDKYVNWPTTWGEPDIKISWAALAAFCDEAHSVVDSVDTWKKTASKYINVAGLIEGVNKVSNLKI